MVPFKKFNLVIIVTLIAVLSISCSKAIDSCGKESEATVWARSLDESRLALLYADFEKLAANENVARVYSFHGEGQQIPPDFSDLKVVKLRPKRGYILVKGCMDHGVVMSFKGLNKPGETQSIELSWGEVPPHSGSEVIWQR